MKPEDTATRGQQIMNRLENVAIRTSAWYPKLPWRKTTRRTFHRPTLNGIFHTHEDILESNHRFSKFLNDFKSIFNPILKWQKKRKTPAAELTEWADGQNRKRSEQVTALTGW
jgi:hypothetical protein